MTPIGGASSAGCKTPRVQTGSPLLVRTPQQKRNLNQKLPGGKHEFSAAVMADGYSRGLAGLGVVAATSGGGFFTRVAAAAPVQRASCNAYATDRL
jgi:hypothetical protein